MLNPHPVNSKGSAGKPVDRFAGTWMPSSMKNKSSRKKKSTLDHPQRSWRIRQVSRRVLLWMLLPVMLSCISWLGYTMLLESDIFRMTSVSVKGQQVMNQQQILNMAGIRNGLNLLSMDVKHFESLIRQEPWIEQVWIKRHWPSTLEIVVSEHKPFALINLENSGVRQLYYLNDDGKIFAPATTKKDLDYPVINGSFSSEEFQGKQLQKDSPGAMALEFLQLTARGSQVLPTQAVSEISVDPDEGLIVYLVDHPFPIYMGKEKIRLRFGRLVKVLAKLYKEDKIKGVAEIRMDYADKKILVTRTDEA